MYKHPKLGEIIKYKYPNLTGNDYIVMGASDGDYLHSWAAVTPKPTDAELAQYAQEYVAARVEEKIQLKKHREGQYPSLSEQMSVIRKVVKVLAQTIPAVAAIPELQAMVQRIKNIDDNNPDPQ